VDAKILLGLLLGLVAIGVGVLTLVTAVLTRRRKADIAETYATTGGVVYTVVQFGCAGVLILAGLAVCIVVLVAGH
jgi:hypothetical protein